MTLRSRAIRGLVVSLLGTLAIGTLPNPSVAVPSHVHLATIPAASAPWLNHFNAWRASVGLSNLSENTTWSAGDVAHATYMVKTGLVTHYEDPTNPYYTTAGDAAARASNTYVSSSTGTSDVQAIDWWMGAPFHAMAMMDPRLTQTGFGSYRDASFSPWQMGAALNVTSGNPFTGGQFPVYFPGNLSTEPLTAYSGNEFPDPTGACPGYSGLPVFVEVGGSVSTTAGPIHTLTANAGQLANCVIDSTNPNYASYLTGRGAVIMMPQQPLQNGTTYTVALTVNSIPYTWSFTVGSLSPACSSLPIVTSVNPSAGPASGGTTVTISGCRFTGVTAVKFGSTAATNVNFVSDTQITAASPAHAGGAVDVTVTTASGTSVINSADGFTYTVPPGPPTNVTATVGNLSATIAWSPPASDGGSPITSYTVTSSPGGLTTTVSGSSLSTVVSGLTLGTTYTFTVVATNSIGSGNASPPSNQITAVTVPSAPMGLVATAADGSAILSWTAPSDGGSAIKAYVVTPYANGVSPGTPVTFTQPNQLEVVFGLTNGVTYTFTVRAVNDLGIGAASTPSNGVMPSSSLRQPSAQGPTPVPGVRAPTGQSSPAPSPPQR
jgi:IPT/TIG domain/Fibronectin type III domain/Cysteine-rich secretory protein family